MDEEDRILIEQIERVIRHPLSSYDHMSTALTHRSFVNEAHDENILDNERLEFLGDAVLQLAVSDWLMREFPKEQEGALSKYRSAIVNERALAQAARDMDLGKYLKLGRGEELTQGRKKDSILADAFEAVVAALYMQGGIGDAERFVVHYLGKILSLRCFSSPCTLSISVPARVPGLGEKGKT